MTPALSSAREPAPPESVLGQLRIPFVERAESMKVGDAVEIRFPWPGSEVPFSARCRVAWWHPSGAPLSSKSLPPGAGLQFVEMSPTDRDRLRDFLVDYCRQNPRVRRFLRHWPESER